MEFLSTLFALLVLVVGYYILKMLEIIPNPVSAAITGFESPATEYTELP